MATDLLPPPLWLVIPFAGLLLMIATGPVLYPHFWHRFYPCISGTLGLGVVGYYVMVMGDYVHPIEALAEYVQFIALLGALYMVSGAILIRLDFPATPQYNLILLWLGAVLSNFIGTTGASMLLIRPYMKMNKRNLKPYHIVFFIFMVSNIGGSLSPIADPPLFLLFLKGLPFSWPFWQGILPWGLALGLLSLIFYGLERHNKKPISYRETDFKGVSIAGAYNLLLFCMIIGAVFLDPKKIEGLPCINFEGHRLSYLRELILLSIMVFVYLKADRKLLAENHFTLAPLKEVAFIFIGIFATMMPALALIEGFAGSETGKNLISPSTLYWGTGLFSSILDNAPTCVTMLTAAMVAKLGNKEIIDFIAHYPTLLRAIAVASVFFGAMTYVGNGPNFMVRSIAEERGVKMPSFGGYIWRYSLPFLLPILVVVWACFFAFAG
ncbi:MAG: sodium:proton antiporter [Cytophagales bacterium]